MATQVQAVYLMTLALASAAMGSLAIWAGVLTGAAAMAYGRAASSGNAIDESIVGYVVVVTNC
jgi:hypothetical protein